jgi:hypothetical protein
MVRFISGMIVLLVVAGSPVTCSGALANLAKNPGFDDWESPSDAAAWNEITHQWISYQQNDVTGFGPPCMEVVINGNTANGVWQSIEVGTGTLIQASAWVRPQTLPGQSFTARVGIEPWGMDSIWSADMVWSDEAPLNAWTNLSVETVSKGPRIAVYIGVLAGAGGVSYRIDDVVVTPEPTTFALLGLGAAVLLRKKSRR